MMALTWFRVQWIATPDQASEDGFLIIISVHEQDMPKQLDQSNIRY